MSWLLTAITGHLMNAFAFIVDKTLLSSAFKRSGTYAAMIGSLSLIVLFGIPFIREWPSSAIWPAVAGFGGFYVFALWLFFEALKHEEASRVIPIIGSLIPIFTFAATSTFFHERLALGETVGFAFLLIATWLLTSGSDKRGRLMLSTLLFSVASALIFAASSVLGKYAFDHGNFYSVFICSRIITGIVGLGIAFLAPGVWTEVKTILRKKNGETKQASWLAVIGQLSGAIGFILVHLSIAQGSAAIVNALQAVQYAGIILVAWIGGRKIRVALKEEVSFRTVVVKTLAIVCVGIGLYLIA